LALQAMYLHLFSSIREALIRNSPDTLTPIGRYWIGIGHDRPSFSDHPAPESRRSLVQ
jgi:hypothetical protein